MQTPSILNSLLTNPAITDICINGNQGCFIDQGDGMVPAPGWSLSETDTQEWILQSLASLGKSWDARHPFVDATLPSGHRLHVAFPPLSRQGLLVSLRRLPGLGGRSASISSPVVSAEQRWQRGLPLFQKMQEAVIRGESILISGATGSGKTTLINDLLASVSPTERLLILEETAELGPEHPHFISLTSRPPNADGFGEVTLRTLMKQSLRMRPDRIILGECRGPEVLELLQCLNTGHHGALATLHANSPRDALRRIELLCLLAAQGSISSSVIRELLSVGIQWIAQVRRTSAGREVSELHRIEGKEADTILMRPIEPCNIFESRAKV